MCTHAHTCAHARLAYQRKTDGKRILLITSFKGEGTKRKGSRDVKGKQSHEHMVQRLSQSLCPAWNLFVFLWEEKRTSPLHPSTPSRYCQRQLVGAIIITGRFMRDTETQTTDWGVSNTQRGCHTGWWPPGPGKQERGTACDQAGRTSPHPLVTSSSSADETRF